MRHVEDRFNHLLLLVKKEFGQTVVQGSRLSVRLTHQNLADACSTTKVTITRLLGKLQKQRKVTLDSLESHLQPLQVRGGVVWITYVSINYNFEVKNGTEGQEENFPDVSARPAFK